MMMSSTRDASLKRVELILLQIGLLLVILLLIPKSVPHAERSHTLTELHHGGGSSQYAVVFDAGSTGSRVHVFKFERAHGGDLKLISDTFEQLKPGLSSFADDPRAAVESLGPLMKVALATVPKELQGATPVSLKATAGLRLLPGDKADRILEAVTAYLKAQPFALAEGGVSILGGQEEGGFAWLTLNYLLGKLGRGPEDTVAAIDLGGGSVQEAFALTQSQAATAPKGYATQLKGAGKVYQVYVHSYLGYGLMAGRAKVIESLDVGSDAHPCFASGSDAGTYAYAGKTYPVRAGKAAEYDKCAKVGAKALDLQAKCGQDQDQCSFNGAWRGKTGSSEQRTYYVSSYFWDRALEAGIIADAKALSWSATAADFGSKASKACSAKLSTTSAVTSAYPSVKADAAPFFCADLTYCHVLLTEGFSLQASAKITLVKQVEYNGQNIEAAWPLGAAINDLSSP